MSLWGHNSTHTACLWSQSPKEEPTVAQDQLQQGGLTVIPPSLFLIPLRREAQGTMGELLPKQARIGELVWYKAGCSGRGGDTQLSFQRTWARGTLDGQLQTPPLGVSTAFAPRPRFPRADPKE